MKQLRLFPRQPQYYVKTTHPNSPLKRQENQRHNLTAHVDNVIEWQTFSPRWVANCMGMRFSRNLAQGRGYVYGISATRKGLRYTVTLRGRIDGTYQVAHVTDFTAYKCWKTVHAIALGGAFNWKASRYGA